MYSLSLVVKFRLVYVMC